MNKNPRVAIYVGNTGFSLYHFRLALMSHMKKAGWDVRAIANEEADFGLKFTKHGISFLNVEIDHKGLNPLNDIRFMLSLCKAYKMFRPRLVHHFTIKPVIFGSLAAKIARVPTIINTITGLGYTFDKSGWLQWMTCRLYKVALRGKAKVIFQNGDDLMLFQKRRIVSKEKGYVIKGSGVDTGAIQQTTVARKKSTLFLMVSRMLWSKGVREFVSAARNVKELYPSSEFIMVGGYSGGGSRKNPDAVEEDWLRQVNREGVVRWMGRVPFETVMNLLNQASVVVLPSYREGVPRSLIEAAAAGKTIITTDTSGCREVVHNNVNGFLIPVKDVDALSSAMLKFCKNLSLINKMGVESRKLAVKHFDQSIIIRQTLNVYREAEMKIPEKLADRHSSRYKFNIKRF